MKKVVIVGGAFDPVTKGHMYFAEHILNNTEYDYAWLMPCYKSLYGKKMVPFDDRMNMLHLAVESFGDDRFRACDYEGRHKLEVGTLEILNHLLRNLPTEMEIAFAVGSDTAYNMSGWVDWKYLLNNHRFIVVERIDWPFNRLKRNLFLENNKQKHIMLEGPDIERISSTIVRKQLKNTNNSNLIDETVAFYVKTRRLYV